MAGFGLQFRTLREAKGATLEQVAAATKVGIRHLDALERDDFAALPGDVFVRGFIRAYASFLGADPVGLLALYRREREGSEADGHQVAERTVEQMSRLLAGASSGAGERARPALRIVVDRALMRRALRIGGLAAALAGAAAIALRVSGPGKHDLEDLRVARPLRASRSSIQPVAATAAPDSAATASAVVPTAPLPSVPAPVAALEVPVQAEPVAVQSKAEGLQVSEHAVGVRVEGGKLVNPAATFEEGAAVWFWTRIDGGRAGQTVRHVWLHEQKEIHTVELEVGSAQWRTWSRKTMRPGSAGHWSVEVRDAYGRVLASDEFDCVGRR